MIRFTGISMGEGSPVGCVRCTGPREEAVFHPGAEIVADIERVAAGWSDEPGPNVVLRDAEPFRHPELPRVVAAAAAAGVVRLGVETDAVALQSAGNASGSVMAGVRHLTVTLLAGTPGVHDALAGAPGLLDATLAGLATFRAAAASEGIDVSLTAVVPVCRHNVHELPGAVGVAVESGCDRVLLRLDDGGVSLRDAAPWIVAACDTGVVNGVWVEVEGVPFCVLPGYDLHVADTVRPRAGAKSRACAVCDLDSVCGGAVSGASGDQLADLEPPAFAAPLAAAVRRSRRTGADR